MRDGFGTRLRKRREQQKMSLAAIAEQTKIKASLLDGLERDDVSQWPGGIFRRSFVRAYAQALDLDPDATLREFLAIHPDPVEDIEAVAALASSSPNAKVGKRPPMRLRYLIDAGARALARVLSSSADAAGAAEVDGAQDRRQPLTEVEKAPAPERVDLAAVAGLCTELGRIEAMTDAQRSLQPMANALNATGLIVWVWDPQTSVLVPSLSYGYSDLLLAQLPNVSRDADNATAAAFRSGHISTVGGSERAHGALVVPLIGPAGCLGVLAIELPNRREQAESVRSLSMIFAAQLARIVAASRTSETVADQSQPAIAI